MEQQGLYLELAHLLKSYGRRAIPVSFVAERLNVSEDVAAEMIAALQRDGLLDTVQDESGLKVSLHG